MSDQKDIYVLGTGLSHNGSAVLLKNGKVCVGIEKERITRIKHDGGNDNAAIQYCLDAEGIALEDLSLVVQCANFEIPSKDYFSGKRLFKDKDLPKVVNISHHLAHAYSAIGTSPFEECVVMVIDGCGSPLHQYLQIHSDQKDLISEEILNTPEMQCEKDSFYFYDGTKLTTLKKDFSPMANFVHYEFHLPSTKHSIGGFYAAMSEYVFGDLNDVGKLMGLAPFGKTGIYEFDAFTFDHEDRLLVLEDWKKHFMNPSNGYDSFKEQFQYYANVAKWTQEQVEKAVIKCFKLRLADFPHDNVCYSGGVALNVAANRKLLKNNVVKNLYIEPAAADNGLALGCAYYGWLEYLKKPKVPHNKDTCFGKSYSDKEVKIALDQLDTSHYSYDFYTDRKQFLHKVAQYLHSGKTVAWFQEESEFGPRALGRRSILAHPGIDGMKDHINQNIKFREDFRPFAPAVLKDQLNSYFSEGWESPYMLLLDKTREEFSHLLQNVSHLNSTARVQTVEEGWNSVFYDVLKAFYQESGIPVLLNTSLNKKGSPIVETPKEAVDLFEETALDILAIGNFILMKK